MNDAQKPPVVIIGGGGHASVLADICLQQGRPILAVISPEEKLTREVFQGVKHLCKDEDVLEFSASDIELVNGIGGLPGSQLRAKLASKYSDLGYRFATIVSKFASVSTTATLGEGVQVLQGAIVNTGASVGPHSIINSGAVVEHDCMIESYVHIAPSATICGGSTVREGVQIGPNSVIAQGLEIGAYSVVGAGASVVRSLACNIKLLPAKNIATFWTKE